MPPPAVPEPHLNATRTRLIEHAAHRAGLSEVLEEALERLPLAQRTAIVLREYQGFSSEEIAEILDGPAATVRTRIYYGLKTVRKLLAERGISEPL